MPILLRVPQHYTTTLLPDHKLCTYAIIANFDIVDTVLCRMKARLISYETTRALASYLEWILRESEVGQPISFH